MKNKELIQEAESLATVKLNALHQRILKMSKVTAALTLPYAKPTERTRYAGQLTVQILSRVTARLL